MGTIDGYRLHPAVSASGQLRTLAELRRLTAHAVAAGVRPVIEIDLDLCALRPVFRTASALRTVGEEFAIPEFLTPENLPVLPGYSDEAWQAFVQQLELPKRHPHLQWVEAGRPVRTPDTPFGRFHRLYWTTAWLREDEPTPGLGSFVQSIESLGGRVVFLSGRWLEAQIAPSQEALRRAGLANPTLVIGNPWHETLVSPGGAALSDSALKAWRQADIVRDSGTVIAVIDDRSTNRAAIAACHPGPVASVAIAIPGFTVDEAIHEAELRLSTFEDFTRTIDSPPVRPHMTGRYPGLGRGEPWQGEYAGLGRSGLVYLLPRVVPHSSVPAGEGPLAGLSAQSASGRFGERALLEAAMSTIPSDELDVLRQGMAAAQREAQRQQAAPWPETPEGEQSIWYSLLCAWLHSRDLETLMGAIGYRIAATGQHDLREFVAVAEVRELLLATTPPAQQRLRSARYSPWLLNWARQLPDEPVNVSFLNPALLVDLCQWSPRQTKSQDAMDVHRLSDHHDGDGGERFDPMEAGINNLLHQREGRDGVRKEPVVSWRHLQTELATESGATDMAKNSAARQALRDAASLAPELERRGWLTPWGLCE